MLNTMSSQLAHEHVQCQQPDLVDLAWVIKGAGQLLQPLGKAQECNPNPPEKAQTITR